MTDCLKLLLFLASECSHIRQQQYTTSVVSWDCSFAIIYWMIDGQMRSVRGVTPRVQSVGPESDPKSFKYTSSELNLRCIILN